jgi:Tfp pilus assembly protein PilF
VRLNKDFSEAQNNLCALLMHHKKWDEATKHCMRAVENISYATPERAHHNLGFIYEQKGALAKAIESYRRAISYNKNFVLSLKALGNIYVQQSNTKEAVTVLENASKACNLAVKGAWLSICPEVHWELAKLYIQQKKRTEAIATLKDCEKSDEVKGEYGQKCRDKLRLYQ